MPMTVEQHMPTNIEVEELILRGDFLNTKLYSKAIIGNQTTSMEIAVTDGNKTDANIYKYRINCYLSTNYDTGHEPVGLISETKGSMILYGAGGSKFISVPVKVVFSSITILAYDTMRISNQKTWPFIIIALLSLSQHKQNMPSVVIHEGIVYFPTEIKAIEESDLIYITAVTSAKTTYRYKTIWL
jgi:hypothetical protein